MVGLSSLPLLPDCRGKPFEEKIMVPLLVGVANFPASHLHHLTLAIFGDAARVNVVYSLKVSGESS